jgi:DNA-binding beta-propeller fold protein YncE
MLRSSRRILFVLSVFVVPLLLPVSTSAQEPANEDFYRTWARHDDPVASGRVERTWMWGPQAYTESMMEEYVDVSGGEREVQYFDKARMEINDPDRDRSSIWFVTNGLLVQELISGRLQVGHDTFERREPAEVNIAGDWDDPHGPTYATFNRAGDGNDYDNGVITVRITREGTVFIDSTLLQRGIDSAHRDDVTGHWIARPFWEFMNSQGLVNDGGEYTTDDLFLNPLFATGRPITRAYWANVKVGGGYEDVLLQCFERRCLTYTPDNPDGWQVEAGNVGQHYFAWRYERPPVVTMWEPHAVAIGPDDTVYVGSGRNNHILRYTSEGNYLGQWGSAGDGLGQLSFPTGLALDSSNNLYVVENENHRLQLFTPAGLPFSVWTAPEDVDGQFLYPYGVAIDAQDHVYMTDHFNHRVLKFTSDGSFVTAWGRHGTKEPGEFNFPSGIAVDRSGTVYVSDTLNNRVQIFTSEGEFIGQLGGSPPASFSGLNSPYGVVVRDDGKIFVADSENQRIQIFNPDYTHRGNWDMSWVGQFSRPVGVTLDDSGNLYVVDAGEYQVLKLDSRGELTSSFQ